MTKSPILQSLQTLHAKRAEREESGSAIPPGSTTPVSKSALVLMLLVATISLCFGLSGYKTLSSHEIYTAVGAREMIESGDYIVPHQAGLPRLKKPPLGYWVIVGVAKLTGRVDELSARVPAVVCAALLCLLTGIWASRWYGRNAGIFAAFAQSTTLFVILYGRKSEVDMCLTLLDATAMFLIVFQPAGQTWKAGFVRWLGIFALLGLSTLSKFHYGPAMVLIPCAIYWAIQKRWGDFKHTLNPVGWLLWLGPICIWIAMVLARIPNALEIWHHETIGRAMGEMPISRPLWFYIVPILWMSLPWTPLWMWEARRSWSAATKEADSNERFLWCWLLANLAVVSLQPDKHPQYVLSAMPIFALWVGRRLGLLHQSTAWVTFRWTRTQATLLSTVTVAGAVAVAWMVNAEWSWLSQWGIAFATVLAIGGLSAIGLTQFGKQRQAIACVTLTATGLFICGMEGILPGRDHWRAQADFSARVQSIAGEQPIAGYKLSFSPLYYLGPNLHNHRESENLRERLGRQGSLLLVSQERHLETLEQLGKLEPVATMTGSELKLAGFDFPLACWKLSRREEVQIGVDPETRQIR